jgi:hypothetical protein
MESQRTRTAKTVLKEKSKHRGLTLPDLKIYYEATVIKQDGPPIRRTYRPMDIEESTQKYMQIIFDHSVKTRQCGEVHLFNK